MGENIKMNIKGEITIKKNSEIIFRDHNSITADAVPLIVRCLVNTPENPAIDLIQISGDFDTFSIPVSNTEYSTDEPNSITFIGVILESQAVGTISTLRLGSDLLELFLAEKTGMTTVKNDITRLEIRWKITINN